MEKTTIYLDGEDYGRLKALARAKGCAAAELVRAAVAEYARRHAGPSRPRSIGAGRSGRGDLGQRADDYLAGLGRS